MISSPRFLTGVAAGALVAWWVMRRRAGRLIEINPLIPRPLRRSGRLGPYPSSYPYPERGSQR